MTGVDLSANSISSAKKYETDGLRFDVHDMREVYKKETFDAVFNLFTSFGYFESDSENEKVLRSMRSMLEDDGVLVIDFMNAHKSIKNLVPSEEKTIDDITFNIERSFDGSHIYKRIEFVDEGKLYKFQERVQAIKKERFLELFEEVGLDVIDTFGDFSLTPFDLEESDRLIFICKKK